MWAHGLLLDVADMCVCCCSPKVNFCGYSIPHPSEPKMNMRLQTAGTQLRPLPLLRCLSPSPCSRTAETSAKPPPRLSLSLPLSLAGEEVNATMKTGLSDLCRLTEHIGETFKEALGTLPRCGALCCS